MKMCRYLRLPDLVTNIFFAIFAISWIITRHILFSFVIYSAYDRGSSLIHAWEPERGYYLTRNAYIGFIALMIALQVSPTKLGLTDLRTKYFSSSCVFGYSRYVPLFGM